MNAELYMYAKLFLVYNRQNSSSYTLYVNNSVWSLKLH